MTTLRHILLGSAAALLLAVPSLAADTPAPGQRDERVRTQVYRPDDVTRLVASVGQALTVEFSERETITAVAASDTERVMITGERPQPPYGRFLFIKAKTEVRTQPITVITRREDGSSRRYLFEFRTREAPIAGSALVAGPGAPTEGETAEAFYSVRFAHPQDEAEDRRRRAREAAAERNATLATRRLREPTPAVVHNEQYAARGDAALAPSAVWDDGQSTFMRFPGNRRLPTFYGAGPDGEDMAANFSFDPNSGVVTLHGVGRRWRLIDGKAVLCVFNIGPSGDGVNYGTGTTSPDVVREPIARRAAAR
jgi:type IV secretion system protein VirB9